MAEQSRKSEKYHELTQLSTEELENRLSMGWLATSQEEDELLDTVAEVIIEREADKPTGRFADVDASWNEIMQSFSENANQPNVSERQTRRMPGRKRLLRRVASVAAVIAATFLCLILVQAGGIDIFGTIGKWTNDIFYFEQDPTGTTAPSTTSVSPEIDSAFREYNIPVALAPKGDLGGMTLTEVHTSQSAAITDASILLSDENGRTLFFNIIWYRKTDQRPEHIFEKTENEVEEYRHNDMNFYIFENTGERQAVWSNGEYVIQIVGDVDRETIIAVINSI